ncbi:endonuclease III domain-containing protein [Roseimaritima ulvae]|uniref:Endonuclease III n=1 Tax=Roseimaritima ulvae TaxID=980254 RepID=A0A5B9QPR2_9BACT|nr:endonuclease III [Roseimaritima ulvae]QEG40944.1 Endonuclease III [Roseimaritima ulvae]
MANQKDTPNPPSLSPREIERFYTILSQTMPGRSQAAKGPKGQPNPFRTCLSCILSAQSLDRNTALATKALFKLARTPRTMLQLDVAEIATAIKPCGLYNVKAKNIHKFCAVLIDEFNGVVPQSRDQLMRLPGIGRKCADIVLQFAFGIDTIAVDTHVFRVCNRTGLAYGKTADRTADLLQQRTPSWAVPQAHFWLIQFGKTVCLSRSPRCPVCAVNGICQTYKQQVLG